MIIMWSCKLQISITIETFRVKEVLVLWESCPDVSSPENILVVGVKVYILAQRKIIIARTYPFLVVALYVNKHYRLVSLMFVKRRGGNIGENKKAPFVCSCICSYGRIARLHNWGVKQPIVHGRNYCKRICTSTCSHFFNIDYRILSTHWLRIQMYKL